MDLFIGRPANRIYLDDQKITHLEALTVTIVEKPNSQSCVYDEPSFHSE
jgi:hypothetical protein